MRLDGLLKAYLPNTRSGRILSCGAALDSLGTGLFLSLLPVFLVRSLGVEPFYVGLIVGLANLIALFASIPTGWLCDLLGAGFVWKTLVVIRMVGYTGFLFVDSFLAYALLTCLLVPLDRGSGTAQQAFVVRSEPPGERSRSMAGVRTARNVGMSVGLLLTGVVLGVGTDWAFQFGFLVNALSYGALLAAVVAVAKSGAVMKSGEQGERPSSGQGSSEQEVEEGPSPFRNRRYLTLVAGDTLVLFHDSLLFTLFPLWLVSRTEIPDAMVGPLLALNTVLTVLLQVPFTRWAKDHDGARRTVIAAVGPLLACCLLFAAAEMNSGVVVATTLAVLAILSLTVGENLHSVGSFELSHRMAPPALIGRYLGVFNLGNSVQLTIGPPLMTAVVLRGPAGWIVLAGAFTLGTLLMAAGARRSGESATARKEKIS
ncbi:MFS transporter [Nocardiopsis alkaliphila]|uniref:MFS transporter n=1 Tax=Nocardiopsis alkaliphila TaxID=225762 RepID=UPI00034BEE2F|nr:MFS transporter [Nocardiopsis alkaliphila]